MTEPDPHSTLPDPSGSVDPSDSESDRALERYRLGLRRPRLVYFAVVAAILVALGVAVGVAYSRGEANTSVLRTVADAPASLPASGPGLTVRQIWRKSDRAAIGTPQSGGTVIVWGRHTVRGIDARTGKQTWSYTRSNRVVCTAAQLDGITIAVFELDGNCDQATALDSSTGKRTWDRTLNFDGLPLSGRPTFQPYTAGGYNTLLVTSASVIYALDPVSGYNRWTYSHFGCDITGAAIGTAGVLIAQNCVTPRCKGKLKFCGKGRQLLLRDGFEGRDDKSDTNPDKITWNLIGTDAIPASADGVLSAVDARARTLVQFDKKTGATLARTPLATVPTSSMPIVAVATTGPELIWLAGTLYAVREGSPTPAWTAQTAGAPTLLADDGPDAVPDLDTARVSVPSRSGVAMLNGTTGRPTMSLAVPAPAAGSLVYALGPGVLVAGPASTVAYA